VCLVSELKITILQHISSVGRTSMLPNTDVPLQAVFKANSYPTPVLSANQYKLVSGFRFN